MIDPSKPLQYVEQYHIDPETGALAEKTKEITYFGIVYQKGWNYHAVRITGSKASPEDQWIGLFFVDDPNVNSCILQGSSGGRFIRNFEPKPNDWI